MQIMKVMEDSDEEEPNVWLALALMTEMYATGLHPYPYRVDV